MAKHYDRTGNSITYRWRFFGACTPRRLDLHPVVNEWRGPHWLVSVFAFLWRHSVRSHVNFAD